MTISAADILGATKAVTKEWSRQRKAEERGSRSRHSRMYVYYDHINFHDVAKSILPDAYDHVSGGGMYPVAKRQLYYACREHFKEHTGRELKADYFSQTLLVQYINRHPDETSTWKITADPRGTLTIPNSHNEVRIPCGTIDIEEHLEIASKPLDDLAFELNVPSEFPSLKHGERYQAVLYIEKEGFEPLLEEAKIAERYDLAILSCKGQSVVAARHYVDQVCSVGNGVPLLVVHDFDKAGFEISQCLTKVSRWAEANDRVAYRFENQINVTDLGLRLADVKTYGLVSETVDFKGHFSNDSITTTDERRFLRSGRRVELNAFTSPQFIEWLESKLVEQGLAKRLVPDDEVLEAAFRRALAVAHINGVIDGAVEEAERIADEATVPKTLKRQLRQKMKERDEAWDKALYRLAESKQEHSKE
jgi:hypothetical protein